MSRAAGEQKPWAPRPPSLLLLPQRTFGRRRGRRTSGWGAWGERRALGKVAASHPERTASWKHPHPHPHPLHLFALTPLYVRFHLKALTTYLETETDRKPGRRRQSRAVCQSSGRMLTAAVGGDVSTEATKKNGKFERWQGERRGGKRWSIPLH